MKIWCCLIQYLVSICRLRSLPIVTESLTMTCGLIARLGVVVQHWEPYCIIVYASDWVCARWLGVVVANRALLSHCGSIW